MREFKAGLLAIPELSGANDVIDQLPEDPAEIETFKRRGRLSGNCRKNQSEP